MSSKSSLERDSFIVEPPEDFDLFLNPSPEEALRFFLIDDGEDRLRFPVIFFISSTEAVCGTLSASTGFITTCNFRGSSSSESESDDELLPPDLVLSESGGLIL